MQGEAAVIRMLTYSMPALTGKLHQCDLLLATMLAPRSLGHATTKIATRSVPC